MPPLICLDGFGRVCRLIIITPSISSLPVVRSTSSTRPVLPLSRPEITFTWSFFLMRSGFLPARSNDVAKVDARSAIAAARQDVLELSGTAVVGHLQNCSHSDH